MGMGKRGSGRGAAMDTRIRGRVGEGLAKVYLDAVVKRLRGKR